MTESALPVGGTNEFLNTNKVQHADGKEVHNEIVEIAAGQLGAGDLDLDALKRLADAVEGHHLKKARRLRRRTEEATLIALLLN
jgi:hypothetical protein